MNEIMKPRFRIYRRHAGVFCLFDRLTGKRESLETSDPAAARRLLHARNEAQQQPLINRQIARAYLVASDPEIGRRTWRIVFDEIVKTKHGPTQERRYRASRDAAFGLIRDLPVFETQADHFLKVLERGKVATNVFLRRLHNFAVDVGWLPWPILPKKQWPVIRFKPKRAIMFAEHADIVERERRSAQFNLSVQTSLAHSIRWPIKDHLRDAIDLLETRHISGGRLDPLPLECRDERWASGRRAG